MYKNMNAVSLGIRATLSEAVELALLGGFQGIDANMPEVSALAEGQGFRYVRSIFESAKLKVGTWRLPVSWQDDDATFESDLEKLKDYAELAQKVGATRTVTVVAPASDERPFRENFEWHCERFRRVADVLATHNCRLGLGFNAVAKARAAKPFEFIHTLDALVQLAGGVGSANVGVVLDTWHVHVAAGSIEEVRKLRAQQVVAVQLNDVPEGVAVDQLSENDRLLPGATGVIDSVAVLATLRTIGYEGPVTPEPSSRTARQMSREQAARKAGEAMTRHWQAAGLVPTAGEREEATASAEA